jgi:hypothetical protein
MAYSTVTGVTTVTTLRYLLDVSYRRKKRGGRGEEEREG